MEHHNSSDVNVREQVWRGNFKLLFRLLLIGGLICMFTSLLFIDVAPILAAFPLLSIGLMAWSKGYVGIGMPERWNRPEILFPVILGGCFSWLVAMFAAPNFVNYLPLVPWCLGVGLIMLLPFVITIRKYAHKPHRWIWLSLVCLLSGTIPAATGLMISLNYRLDQNAAKLSRGIVLDRDKSPGRRGDSYTIDVHAPELGVADSRFSVPKYWYEAVDRGDTIALLSGKGRFGAPWFRLYGVVRNTAGSSANQ